ncbi:predicted protein [Plenodomus lingam JN3]|uniref:Predicted protein n=1 Tax=Leptosphaeria maculans (strain JN3 / isolate v23.1.3 / race Av1-4-5-6-7-8) TaxID=985895 RepID=E5A8G9_LEPMJ|nr:predicted protein [Plenodomus lingam JN3]CBX99914.1 predicted protein [Plenodomus lingam JN3]
MYSIIVETVLYKLWDRYVVFDVEEPHERVANRVCGCVGAT